jgi:hypothetical protein
MNYTRFKLPELDTALHVTSDEIKRILITVLIVPMQTEKL